MYFLKEAEFKVKNNHLTNNQKIEKFFEFYNLLHDSECDLDSLESPIFINNYELNSYFEEEIDEDSEI